MEKTLQQLKPLGALTLLCVACLTIMVGCVIVPGLPGIASALGVPSASSWLVTLPSLGVAIFGLAVGRLIERIGSRRALLAGLGLYGLLGYAAVWMHGYVAVLLNRFLLGGATAIVMSAGTTLISEFFDGDARLKMIARQGMAIELGGVVFLAIGGILAGISWQHPFLLYLVSWIFAAMVIVFVPRTHESPRSAEANISISAPPMWDVYLAATCSMIVFFAAVILLPQKLAEMGLGEAEIGYFLSFISLVAVGAAFTMPYLIGPLGAARTSMSAFAAYAVGHLLFFSAGSLSLTILGGILIGCGFGFSIPLVNHLTIERSPPALRGRLLGYLSVAIFMGQFLSAFIEMLPISRAGFFLVAALVAFLTLCVFATRTRAESNTRNSHA
ncbi:MFS transporter [Agrobacterium rhizogenes]|nr:MFS transporter [Rhizobium rhizogenes]NTJ79434.1 MFS transporter [Rhizobium rhizogenes]